MCIYYLRFNRILIARAFTTLSLIVYLSHVHLLPGDITINSNSPLMFSMGSDICLQAELLVRFEFFYTQPLIRHKINMGPYGVTQSEI